MLISCQRQNRSRLNLIGSIVRMQGAGVLPQAVASLNLEKLEAIIFAYFARRSHSCRARSVPATCVPGAPAGHGRLQSSRNQESRFGTHSDTNSCIINAKTHPSERLCPQERWFLQRRCPRCNGLTGSEKPLSQPKSLQLTSASRGRRGKLTLDA